MTRPIVFILTVMVLTGCSSDGDTMIQDDRLAAPAFDDNAQLKLTHSKNAVQVTFMLF